MVVGHDDGLGVVQQGPAEDGGRVDAHEGPAALEQQVMVDQLLADVQREQQQVLLGVVDVNPLDAVEQPGGIADHPGRFGQLNDAPHADHPATEVARKVRWQCRQCLSRPTLASVTRL